jgi:hypothetical protein
LRKHIWVLLAYFALALALTWPMAARFATHVPGDGIDDPSLAWNLWWIKHALVDQPQNPFFSAWQFWPIGVNLAFYTLTILNGLLSVPLQISLGLIPAYNLLLLSSFVLGGLGAYLLCLDVAQRLSSTVRRCVMTLAAFLGGALYAFASAKLFYAALGQGNIASSQWAPFAALYIVRAARPSGRWRDALLAGLFLVLQAYAELTYASFLLIFAGLAAAWYALAPVLDRRGTVSVPRNGAGSPRPYKGIARLVGRFALLGVVFAMGISPFLANMLPDLRAEGDFFTSGGGFADIFSADLAGYLAPTQLHPLLGGIVEGWSAAAAAAGRQFPVNKGQQIYLGYVALGLAMVGVWWGRRRGETWFWAAATGLFFLLTLGPSLRIMGDDTGIPLPFRIMERLPFFKGNRYPSRYSVMLLVSAAPLVALGAYRVLAWLRTARAGSREPGVLSTHARHSRPVSSQNTERGNGNEVAASAATVGGRAWATLAFILLLGLMLFEHLSAPLPVFDLRVPALYQLVAADPADLALLELPLGWRNGARVAGKQDILIMQQLWYESLHGKRVLGGNTSRNPELKFQYFTENPTLARLISQTNAADLPQHAALRAALAAMPVTDADRANARAWAAFNHIGYVMMHRDKMPGETEALAKELLPLELLAEDGDLALYRVNPAAPPQEYDLATAPGRMALAEGWNNPPANLPEGAEPTVLAQRDEARLLLPLPKTATRLDLTGWSFAPDQQVTLVVDGHAAGTQHLPESPTTISFDVPADDSRGPLSDVRLRFSHTIDLEEWGQRLSRAGPVGLLVRSAGQETGDFAHIYVNGVDRSPNQRGYNLVALDRIGTFLGAQSFDTHTDPAASARLAEWVQQFPVDTWIVGAVRDEASANLGQDAVDALRSLGVQADLRGHFRWGHAFMGRVGAEPGSATEALNGINVAQVDWGFPASSPRVAAAFSRAAID